MEKEPLVNRFISVPRDKSSLNCAVFIAGIIEAVLTGTGFVSINLLQVVEFILGKNYLLCFNSSSIFLNLLNLI
jgi:hypothetical protein